MTHELSFQDIAEFNLNLFNNGIKSRDGPSVGMAERMFGCVNLPLHELSHGLESAEPPAISGLNLCHENGAEFKVCSMKT